MNGLRPEDYLEPGCIFCKPEDENAKPVDLRRYGRSLTTCHS